MYFNANVKPETPPPRIPTQVPQQTFTKMETDIPMSDVPMTSHAGGLGNSKPVRRRTVPSKRTMANATPFGYNTPLVPNGISPVANPPIFQDVPMYHQGLGDDKPKVEVKKEPRVRFAAPPPDLEDELLPKVKVEDGSKQPHQGHFVNPLADHAAKLRQENVILQKQHDAEFPPDDFFDKLVQEAEMADAQVNPPMPDPIPVPPPPPVPAPITPQVTAANLGINLDEPPIPVPAFDLGINLEEEVPPTEEEKEWLENIKKNNAKKLDEKMVGDIKPGGKRKTGDSENSNSKKGRYSTYTKSGQISKTIRDWQAEEDRLAMEFARRPLSNKFAKRSYPNDLSDFEPKKRRRSVFLDD